MSNIAIVCIFHVYRPYYNDMLHYNEKLKRTGERESGGRTSYKLVAITGLHTFNAMYSQWYTLLHSTRLWSDTTNRANKHTTNDNLVRRVHIHTYIVKPIGQITRRVPRVYIQTFIHIDVLCAWVPVFCMCVRVLHVSVKQARSNRGPTH